MITLLAQARRVSNPELEELVGFRLEGRERRKLNGLKLVESAKQGRAFAHELSDAGWRWCTRELRSRPSGRGSMERALYALLGGVDRYLDASGQSLAEVFGAGQGAAAARASAARDGADAGARIGAAYRELASAPGEYVRLRDLRALVADLPRHALDAALTAMYAGQRVNLIPQSNQQALTAGDRESALRVGGELKHLISIGR